MNTSNFQKRFFGAFQALKGGGGVHPVFFVKHDFEITVGQLTRAHDQTFEGVLDSGCPPVPAGQPRPYLLNFWLNFAKSP